MEVFPYIKEVDCSALTFPVYASVHKVMFYNFIYLEKWFKTTTQVNTLAVKTIPEAYIFE